MNSVHYKKWKFTKMDSDGINWEYVSLMRKKTTKYSYWKTTRELLFRLSQWIRNSTGIVLSSSQSKWNRLEIWPVEAWAINQQPVSKCSGITFFFLIQEHTFRKRKKKKKIMKLSHKIYYARKIYQLHKLDGMYHVFFLITCILVNICASIDIIFFYKKRL